MCKILEGLRKKSSEQILEEYYPEDKIPVDIVSVAQKIGIKLGGINFSELEKTPLFKEKVKKNGSILGAVYVSGEDVQIVYDNTLRKNDYTKGCSENKQKDILRKRQRFTIAHEIAHCCLHMKPGETSHIEYRTEQQSSRAPKEVDANIFAGELLIPTESIMQVILFLGRDVSLDLLAELFCVSKKVMKARLEYLIENKIIPPISCIS